MSQQLTAEQFAALRAQVIERLNLILANAIPRRQRSHRTALLETTAIYPTRQGVFKVFAMCGVTT